MRATGVKTKQQAPLSEGHAGKRERSGDTERVRLDEGVSIETYLLSPDSVTAEYGLLFHQFSFKKEKNGSGL